MNFFSTWWNNNLLIVINGEGDYGVHLLVYEMPMKVGNPSSGPLERFQIGSFPWSLSEVKNLVETTESNLRRGKNPIFGIISLLSIESPFWDIDSTHIVTVDYEKDYDSSSYPMTFDKKIVRRIELPSDARSNPNNYIKPLDIVLACKRGEGKDRDMVHSCIYLGEEKICHVLGEWNDEIKGKVKIESWNEFLSIISVDKLLRYHPIIPFKKHDEIIKHIAKAVEGTKNYFSPGVKDGFRIWKEGKGRSNNCENFVNVCVLGINFSELSARKVEIRNVTFDIKSCIKETSKKLDELADNYIYVDDKIEKIERCKRRGNLYRIASDVDREGIEMQNCIEVYPNPDFRIGIDSSAAAGSVASLFARMFI